MANSLILSSMVCVAFIVLAALIALVIVLLRPARGKNVESQVTPGTRQTPRKDRKVWIFYFGIALIITIWTYWGALFFLAAVWILSLDPKPRLKEIPFPSDVDRDSAKGLYTWLFLSPLLTVPAMIYLMATMSYYSSINERILAALLPGVLHLLMLSNLATKSQFVYRHTQQALFLAACRAGMAAIALNIGGIGDGIWLFLLGNGSLWLFGTFWARNQAVRRECWWLTRKGEVILPAQAEIADQPVMYVELNEILVSMNATDRQQAKEKSLQAFRTGSSEARKKAVLVLSKLGEVEKF